MSKIKYSTISELAENLDTLFDSLYNNSDTLSVLLAANYIDRCLANALVMSLPIKDKNFIKNTLLQHPDGTLATYSDRNKIAYALNIIDKSNYKDISCLGKIRNHFAHNHLEISFTDDDIIKYSKELTLWEKSTPPYQIEEYKKEPQCNSPEVCKIKFIKSAVEILRYFIGMGLLHKVLFEKDY